MSIALRRHPIESPPQRLLGGVCTPRGFLAGVSAADVRGQSDPARLDIALLLSDRLCEAAGVFTRNRAAAAPVLVSQLALRSNQVRAVVINAGNANACTGSQGIADALQMCRVAAEECRLLPAQVLVCSTGVIGREMPMQRVVPGIRAAAAALSRGAGDAAARAIMTTDTVPKQAVRAAVVDGRRLLVGGMAKGSGMIHSDMATLIAVVTTDATVAPGVLRPLLRRVAGPTFNCVSVDGDTSTNDSLLLLANGAAGGDPLHEGSAGLAALGAAVLGVCDDLAEQVAADGEGATRHFRVEVRGAADAVEARRAARTVASSPLVKTAIHGCDPNWGRIVAAIGRSGAEVVLDQLEVTIGGLGVFERGAPVPVDLDAVRDAFSQRRIDITIDLGAGEGAGHAWGCDLSAEYVRINASYTT